WIRFLERRDEHLQVARLQFHAPHLLERGIGKQPPIFAGGGQSALRENCWLGRGKTVSFATLRRIFLREALKQRHHPVGIVVVEIRGNARIIAGRNESCSAAGKRLRESAECF